MARSGIFCQKPGAEKWLGFGERLGEAKKDRFPRTDMPIPIEAHYGMYLAALALGFEWEPVEDRLHFTPNTQFIEPPGIV
jgi:hypothetical protein